MTLAWLFQLKVAPVGQGQPNTPSDTSALSCLVPAVSFWDAIDVLREFLNGQKLQLEDVQTCLSLDSADPESEGFPGNSPIWRDVRHVVENNCIRVWEADVWHLPTQPTTSRHARFFLVRVRLLDAAVPGAEGHLAYTQYVLPPREFEDAIAELSRCVEGDGMRLEDIIRMFPLEDFALPEVRTQISAIVATGKVWRGVTIMGQPEDTP
jgi:hypothetical protein